MEIINTGNVIFFKGEAESGAPIELNAETEMDIGPRIIQGSYRMKYLTCFTKATVLNPEMSICLKNDHPLFLRFDIGAIGIITLVVDYLKPEEMEELLAS